VVEGLYHVWFSTKGRKRALEGDLGDDARQLLIETAQRTGIRLVQVEVAADHAHLLVALTGTQTLPSVMHQLKGASARSIFLRYPDLRVDLGHNSFWQNGYGWRKITAADVPAVRDYIRTQGDRPLRHNV
jgi:putative transposase